MCVHIACVLIDDSDGRHVASSETRVEVWMGH